MLAIKILWFVFAAVVASTYDNGKTTVVLVPDSDGYVGKVSVTTKAGSKTLTQAYTALKVKQSDDTLSAPAAISKAETKAIFSSALAAQPKAASYFILYFTSGTAQLTTKSQAELNKVVALIKKSQTIDIYISGHTDTQGSDKINAKLALNRAESVANLIKGQLTPNQTANIRATSHGEGDPLVKTVDNVNEPKNRRVEVTIHL